MEWQWSVDKVDVECWWSYGGVLEEGWWSRGVDELSVVWNDGDGMEWSLE